MSPFNRLLLVIKQTAFDAYTAQERMARAAGRVLTYDNLRMGRLKERHDTHMFQVERITKMLQERGVRGRKGKKNTQVPCTVLAYRRIGVRDGMGGKGTLRTTQYSYDG